ncbi:hypothetical protein SAMN05444515_101347 [Ectothiorhodospira marina]|uniref:Uncharacterized protein n=1 Tax=Ectothiorhodospira marina TaxID=1396821 RepID=A0A1H7FV66_9GAMM|nr:hypothetical protein SAMN05444515_101347 [Ectothiorhodospira marina]
MIEAQIDGAELTAALEPDYIQDAGANNSGMPLIRYVKEFNGKRYSAVCSARKMRRMLGLETFYIGRKKQD